MSTLKLDMLVLSPVSAGRLLDGPGVRFYVSELGCSSLTNVEPTGKWRVQSGPHEAGPEERRMTAADDQPPPLARKLNRLFETIHPAGRGKYSPEEVAKAIGEAGDGSISPADIYMLRKGQRDNPTKRHLELLAKFFGVTPLTSSTTRRPPGSRRNSTSWRPSGTERSDE